MDPLIEIETWRGEWYTIHGDGSGVEGVYLATNVDESFVDLPIKTLAGSYASQEGSTYGGKRILQRDLVFGVVITGSDYGEWLLRDSAWADAFSAEFPSKIWYNSGGTRRWLSVQLAEEPRVKMDAYSPMRECVSEVTMTLVAYDPWWYEEDYTDSFTSTESTTDGHFQSSTVTAINPTGQPVWAQWLLMPPKTPTATSMVPRLPDFSWGDKRHNGWQNGVYIDRAATFASRQIVMAEVLANYPVRVDTKPSALRGGFQSMDQTYGQRMKMVRLLYPIPAFTQETELPVGISKAAIGASIQLRIPRPWPRPY